MSNTTLSPNMSMPVPTVSVDPGPDWATNINSCLSVVDGHTHASGSGVPITPAGIDINSDLPFNNNNATTARSVRFYPQTAVLSLSTDVGCIYVAGVDLYYNDGSGNPAIRITQSGSLAGAAGTITGLPSGTASASYSAGTFTFQGATLTPATMAVGPLVVGNAVANSKTVTIAPNAAIASNYSFTLPAALPGTLNYMTLDNAGAVSFNTSGITGSGAVVLSTSPALTTPSFSGIPTGSITAATFTPTFTYTPHNPAGISVSVHSYIQIGNIVYVIGNGTFVTSGSSGGTFIQFITIPVATSSLTVIGGTYTFSSPTQTTAFASGLSNVAISVSIGASTTGTTIQYSYWYMYVVV